MLNWLFGSKKEKLQKEYEKIYSKAIEFQRNGNIRAYSELIAKSEIIAAKIDELDKESSNGVSA